MLPQFYFFFAKRFKLYVMQELHVAIQNSFSFAKAEAGGLVKRCRGGGRGEIALT